MGRCGAPWPGKLRKPPLTTTSILFAPFIALPHGRIGTRDLLLRIPLSLIIAKRFEEKSPRSKKVRHYHIVATSGGARGVVFEWRGKIWMTGRHWQICHRRRATVSFTTPFSMTNFRMFSLLPPPPNLKVLGTNDFQSPMFIWNF